MINLDSVIRCNEQFSCLDNNESFQGTIITRTDGKKYKLSYFWFDFDIIGKEIKINDVVYYAYHFTRKFDEADELLIIPKDEYIERNRIDSYFNNHFKED